MDEHNVHNFWGASPFVDFGKVVTDLRAEKPQDVEIESLNLNEDAPLNILQVGAADCRHTLATFARAHRHPALSKAPLHFYVFESEPEVLARHILLISILLDEDYPVRDRVEIFMEIHGNALLSEKTAAYLDSKAHAVDNALMALNAGEEVADGIGAMIDISLLKYEQRDAVSDALRKTSRKVEFDMAKAWDARLRKNLGERYDFRKNMVDWDYHMRLAKEDKDGVDVGKGSIIHFQHFREWRLNGVAYELRDIVYKEANRSLLSTAYGRTKEFKDRNGQDRGRSVSAWGFWGDVISSPYHSFGTVSEEPKYFKVANKQYTFTAVDVAQFNITGFLNELRTSEVYTVPEDEEPLRAEASQGVTSQEMMAKAKTWKEGGEDEATLQAKEREAEELLNAVVREKCKQVKVFLAAGDLKKNLTGKKKFNGVFDITFVGAHSVHLLGEDFKIREASKPGAHVIVESGDNLLFLKQEAAVEFRKKATEIATTAGWKECQGLDGRIPQEDMVFRSPHH